MANDTNNGAVDELLEAIYGYVGGSIVPVYLRDVPVALGRNHSQSFNARVDLLKGEQYNIVVFDGCVAGLLETIADAGREHETIADSFASLSQRLFGEPSKGALVRRYILCASLRFVIFHEIAHVTNGHFAYRKAQRAGSPDASSLHFEEATATPAAPYEQAKLLELDADVTGFDFLLACGYEFLISCDDFREHLGEIHEPEELPEQVESALGEALLYACSAVMFVIDAQSGSSGFYPSPEARVLGLAQQLAVRLGIQADYAAGRHTIPLTDGIKARFERLVVPAVLNALEFGVSCSKVRAGLYDPRDEAREHRPREMVLAADVLSLFVARDNIVSAGARELADYLDVTPAFQQALKPNHLKLWWRSAR